MTSQLAQFWLQAVVAELSVISLHVVPLRTYPDGQLWQAERSSSWQVIQGESQVEQTPFTRKDPGQQLVQVLGVVAEHVMHFELRVQGVQMLEEVVEVVVEVDVFFR